MLSELLTPEKEIVRRVRKFQDLLETSRVDGAIILQNADLFYFTGTLAQGILFIPRQGETTFFIKRNFERSQVESRIKNIVRISSLPKGISALSELMGEKPEILGMELDVIPANYYFLFKDKFPDSDIIDISNLIRECRKIKSEFEIAQMKKAAGISISAFGKIPSLIKEGITEIELSSLIEYEIRKRGHQGLIRTRTFNMEFHFGPVVSGTSANYPISFDGPVGAVGLYPGTTQSASTKKIPAGEPVLIDFVSGYNGYYVDMARVFAIGEVKPELLKTHQFIQKQLLPELENMIIPGTNGKDIYNRAIQMTEKRGLSENFMGFRENKVKFIAHGIGLELDEIPILSGRIDVILEPGMTFALEPKIFIKDVGGAGVENTYLVTDSGFEKLTKFEEDIILV